MISIATLDGLQDDELRTIIEQSQQLLTHRDEQRKAKAIEDARATLAAAGLTLKDLNENGKRKPAKGPVYRSGRSYQHPTNKALIWNAKGQKPNWLRDLEATGGKAIELAGLPVNDNAVAGTRKTG
jgi:TRAP-type C4-dicarboxylate transport system substrate-binding protein